MAINNPYIPGDPYSYDLKWIVDKLKEAIALYEPLSSEFSDLKTYVHDYFDNLDLSEEVREVVTQMQADGFFDELVNEIVLTDGNLQQFVTTWLQDNVTPVGSAVVVDASLSVSGAAADAAVTGEYAKTRLGLLMDGSGHYDDDDLTFLNHNISTNGLPSTTTNFDCSERLPVGSNMNRVAVLNSGQNGAAAIAFYSDNYDGAFLASLNNIPETDPSSYIVYNVPDGARYFRFCGRKTHTTEIQFFADPTKNQDTFAVEWLGKVASGGNARGLVHFSFDDVWEPLYKLVTQAPASIYDIDEFAELKQIHDDTGAVFTLNVFNTYSEQPAYDISNIPNTWEAEFQTASNWLKFAFHGNSDSSDYSGDTTLRTDYNKFGAAVAYFTGTTDTIDLMPRLSYFAGSLDQLTEVKAANYPPIGFLTQDDNRLPYYLNAAQRSWIDAHSILFESNNQFIFIKSIARLDSNSATSNINYVGNRLTIGYKYIECFSHDFTSTSLQKIRDVVTWAASKNFMNGYPYRSFN